MVTDTDPDPRLARLVHKIAPQSKLLRTWPLQGGLSAQMTALEIRRADGQTQRLIVRRPGAQALQHNPHAAAHEFRTLQTVRAAGVAAQTPLLLDPSGDIFPEPYLVVEYAEREPDFAATGTDDRIRQMAAQLAAIHRVAGATPALAFLPRQADRLADAITRRPARLDHALGEARIRDILEAVWPLPPRHAPALLHGDFWPGNLLWRDGRLAAVIDWEDAEIGDPLADLAVTRLDLLWIYGRDAMQAFTRAYCDLAAVDCTQLPYWDLVAALRPASHLAGWAAGWPELGRPDIIEQTMAAQHRWFVAQALAQIAARP